MIDFVIRFGEFIVGCLALAFVLFAVVALIIEIYDNVKERGETNEKTKNRLKSIKDGES